MEPPRLPQTSDLVNTFLISTPIRGDWGVRILEIMKIRGWPPTDHRWLLNTYSMTVSSEMTPNILFNLGGPGVSVGDLTVLFC